MSKDSHEENHFHPISDARNLEVPLSLQELLFIDDHITLLVSDHDFEHVVPLKARLAASCVGVDIGFIQLIGKALLEAFSDLGRDVTVEFSSSDLLTVREIALTPIQYGNSNVGVSLKRKVYKALFAMELKGLEEEKNLDSLLEGLDIDLGEGKI